MVIAVTDPLLPGIVCKADGFELTVAKELKGNYSSY